MLKYTTPKHIAKSILQYFAAKFGAHTKIPKEPQLLILMYHRILPLNDTRVDTEEPGMIVTPETFRKHLEILKEYFEFTTITQWIEKKESIPLKSCAITFDDGWLDNYEFAYPILKEMNIPATIFIVSDMMSTNKIFWPERLSSVLKAICKDAPHLWSNPTTKWITNLSRSFNFSNPTPSNDEIASIINSAKKLTDESINNKLDAIETELYLKPNKSPSLLSWEQIIEMSNSGLIEIGSHGRTHTRLDSKATLLQIKDEIKESKDIIESKIKKPVKSFCFPNGDFTKEALDFVKGNYIGSVTTKSGWNSQKSDPYLLQRIGVHEDVSDKRISFLSRISGWF